MDWEKRMEHTIWCKKMYRALLCSQTGVLQSLHSAAGVPLTDGKRNCGTICYTKNEDDLTAAPKPAMNPWTDREAVWEEADVRGDAVFLRNHTLGLQGKYEFEDEYIHLELEQTQPLCSEVGLNLPLSFLGKKGGDYRYQLLPTTPYRTADGSVRYWYLDSPQGQPLLIVAHGAMTWKLDYLDEICGHFITNLKWLYQLDRQYQMKNTAAKMELDVYFPASFEDALAMLSEHDKIPIVQTDKYSVGAGEPLTVRVRGNVERLLIYQNKTKIDEVAVQNSAATLCLPSAGLYRLVPVCGDTVGLECTVGVLRPYAQLFHENVLSLQKPYHCDRGLCEGGVWAEACSLHQRLLGRDESVEVLLEQQLAEIMTADESRMIPRCSIPNHELGGWPAYHVYQSLRSQEAFFAVLLFVDRYRTEHQKQYLDYALGIMQTLMKHYILPNGEIIRRTALHAQTWHDYTTVTAPVLAVVELAKLLRENGDERAGTYEALAVRIADYLVRRGLDFPTEGGVSELTEKEMEDGSISCTALSVLYVCYWVCRKDAYILFARQVLALHESWCMKTPDVRMNRSSLRWWETLWEGDQDGPAICAGHAWTLWRAEADFYLGLVTNDAQAFLNSYNAYGTNLIKIDEQGNSYACFQPDEIPGGGFEGKVEFRLKGGYPRKTDQSLSKYLWCRLAQTWWNTCVVSPERVLNAALVSKSEHQIIIKESVTPIRRIINLTDCDVQLI